MTTFRQKSTESLAASRVVGASLETTEMTAEHPCGVDSKTRHHAGASFDLKRDESSFRQIALAALVIRSRGKYELRRRKEEAT